MKSKTLIVLIIGSLMAAVFLNGCSYANVEKKLLFGEKKAVEKEWGNIKINHHSYYKEFKIPAYKGDAVTVVNGNEPYFSKVEKNSNADFEYYEQLDSLGRAVGAFARVSVDTVPMQEREHIGEIRPSGWHTIKYPDIIDDLYLYNRCHLIAFCLTGENANEKNLITGTRFMNISGMLPYEIKVAEYIEESGNHVLYRATPYYEKNDLVAKGVLIEAYSQEDDGEGICFNVFCHNIQPGIEINYKTGESQRSEERDEQQH